MKDNETLWELIRRLDEQAGQFNSFLAEANRYFDNAAFVTKRLLDRHESDVQNLVSKVKMAFRPLIPQKHRKKKNE